MKKIIYLDESKWEIDILDENKERITNLNNYNFGDELLCLDYNDDGSQIPKEGKYIECIISKERCKTLNYILACYISKKSLIYHGKMFWRNVVEYYYFGYEALNKEQWLDPNWRRKIEMVLFL